MDSRPTRRTAGPGKFFIAFPLPRSAATLFVFCGLIPLSLSQAALGVNRPATPCRGELEVRAGLRQVLAFTAVLLLRVPVAVTRGSWRGDMAPQRRQPAVANFKV
jgi:hypothetical protein